MFQLEFLVKLVILTKKFNRVGQIARTLAKALNQRVTSFWVNKKYVLITVKNSVDSVFPNTIVKSI